MTKAKFYRELDKISNDFHLSFKELLNFKFTVPKTVKSYQENQKLTLQFLEFQKEKNSKSIKYLNESIESTKNIPKIVYPMSIVYAVSLFEVYLNKTTKLLLTYFWQTLKSKDKTISYTDLLSLNTIDQIKEHIINKETQRIAFGSISDRIEFLEKRLNLTFEYERHKGIRKNWNSIEFNDLIEVHSTRNLIIHNNSVVNGFYLKENPTSKLKEGNKRIIDYDYAMHGFFVLFRVSLSIYNVAKKKVKDSN